MASAVGIAGERSYDVIIHVLQRDPLRIRAHAHENALMTSHDDIFITRIVHDLDIPIDKRGPLRETAPYTLHRRLAFYFSVALSF